MNIKPQAILALIFLLSMFSMAWGTLLLEENFDYTEGTTLSTVAPGPAWSVHSTGSNPITVYSPGLTLTDYPSITGLAATAVGTGEDINKSITGTPINSGSVYTSFLLNVTSASTGTSGDYIFHYGTSPIGTTFVDRLYIKRDASNNVAFGLGYGSTITWTSFSYSLATTYMVVVKYQVVAGTTNDVISMWVSPTYLNSETTPTASITNTAADIASIACIALRQGGATSGPGYRVDGIRVATTWAELLPASTSINVSATSMVFSTTVGGTSASQQYTLSRTPLTGTIHLVVDAPFQARPGGGSYDWGTDFYLTDFEDVVDVQYVPSSAGPHSGYITHSSDGVTNDVQIALTGNTSTPPAIVATPNTLTFTSTALTASAGQTYNLHGTDLTENIVVTAPTPYEVSLTGAAGTWGTTVTAVIASGTFNNNIHVRYNPTAIGTNNGVNITNVANGVTTNVALTGTATTPVIVTPATLTYNAVLGTDTAVQSYNLSGINLTTDIVVTAPASYEVSSASATGPWTSTVTVANTFNGNIYVKFIPLAVGTYNGNITNVANAFTTNMALVGSAVNPITVSSSFLTFAAKAGVLSDAQSITLTGTSLTAPITLSSTDPYVFSTTQGGTYTASLEVASSYNGLIWIKFNAPAGSYQVLSNPINIVSGSHSTSITMESFALDPSQTYATDLFISEYLEGSSNNKALEIYNGTGHPVRLSDYKIELFANGASIAGSSLTSTRTLANNDVFIVSHASANATILALADTTSGVAWFNGDDAVAIKKISTNSYVDIFGVIGSDPGTAWTGADGYSTLDKTLVRKSTVTGGITVNPSGTDATAFTTLTTEWDVYASNTTTYLGSHTFSFGGTPAEAPVFSIPGGIQSGPINVVLTSTTPSAQIYYTLDDSVPTDGAGSTLYTGAIPVNSNTTIKAITYATGYSPSSVTFATYTYPVEVANIAALQALIPGYGNVASNGVVYKLTGEVVLTVQSVTRGSKYVQDSTGGLLIDDATGIITTTYALGDGISNLVGTIARYYGMLQLTPSINAPASTNHNIPVVPEVVTLAGLTESHQGKLVTIKNVSVTAALPTFALTTPITNYPISDPSEPTSTKVIRCAYQLDYIGSTVPAVLKDITGVVLQYTSGTTVMQLVPRSLADIVSPTPIDVTVTVVGNEIQLDWAAVTGATYTIQYSDTPNGTVLGTYTSATNTYTTTGGEAATYGKRFYKVIASN